MVSVSYSEAAVEVLDILEHTNKKYVDKIPKKFIEFLKENSSTTYSSNLDHTKSIQEMNLKPKTQALLGLIYMKYWANEEEQINFKNKIKKNEEQLNEKYNQTNLFNHNTTNEETVVETKLPVLIKENILTRIINKIKNIFRR